MATEKRYRSAQTGEFVSEEYAEAHPDVTVSEEVDEETAGAIDAHLAAQKRSELFGGIVIEKAEEPK